MRRDGGGRPVRVWFYTAQLLLPPSGVNCVLAVLQALLGRTWAQLGVGRDTWLKQDQKLVSYKDVTGLIDRAAKMGAALGGLTLPRLRVQKFELLRLSFGVIMGSANIRQNDTMHPHAWGELTPDPN